MDKKAECNLIGIGGLIIFAVGFATKTQIVMGAGIGILSTALYFRVDYLKKKK